MNLLSAILTSNQPPWIVAACLVCITAAGFLVLLHDPANRRAVRLLRALKTPRKK